MSGTTKATTQLGHLARVDDLLWGMEQVGITLRPGTESTSIYIWQTEGHVVYIGKKTDAPTRLAQELGWVNERLDLDSYSAAFAKTIRRQQAVPIAYTIDLVDIDRIRAYVESEMDGFADARADLQQKEELTNAEVETVMIRAITQAGYLLANSTHAGQWAAGVHAAPGLIAYCVGYVTRGTEHDLYAGLDVDEIPYP